jgi:hypothetical protein
MNMYGAVYGMSGNDFYTFLTRDIEEKESLRQAREQEEEKAMYSVSKLIGHAHCWLLTMKVSLSATILDLGTRRM